MAAIREMNWKTLPDCPEKLKHWSGYDPSDPPTKDEMILCDCGHRGFEEEVSDINGLTFCVNCSIERNTDTTGEN